MGSFSEILVNLVDENLAKTCIESVTDLLLFSRYYFNSMKQTW